jgi:hypothetical protein
VTGTTFEIIDNRASDPIHGRFAGLPQGATFAAGGEEFSINYHGGNGNDVVLTAAPARGASTLGPPRMRFHARRMLTALSCGRDRRGARWSRLFKRTMGWALVAKDGGGSRMARQASSWAMHRGALIP